VVNVVPFLEALQNASKVAAPCLQRQPSHATLLDLFDLRIFGVNITHLD
jgi:hypothetical protein